ncbi:hypothetical protein LSTR_LSTR003819 [Laodelphax striatellus]|uniref:tRNA wybutosine-synthesizing protein 4 n=1 Tax=Laodelphax striatellus TaxID=195883 RepID=A0A482XFB9_LAOST|nr:hypothetical protein LSTR_LSTR003819 [Laodelphax striatellus]
MMNYDTNLVPSYYDVTKEYFITKLHVKRQPAVLCGIDIGPCVEKWTSDYLIEKSGSTIVKVHVGSEANMNFLSKNFSYKTLTFEQLVKRSKKKIQDDNDYFFSPKEYYYLRSLSNERRGKQVANLKTDFPELADDVKLPCFFADEQFFSSILRLGSLGMQMWTHYDVMDNFLIQVQGEKRVTLFSPSDASFLYLDGDKSEIVDIDNPDLNKYPNFVKATRYDCLLRPGDVLFIPAFWFHTTQSLSFCINVNVFWKNLDAHFYEKNDYYGNKDLIPASKMLQAVSKAMNNLDSLPKDCKEFYAKRAIRLIEKTLEDNEKSADKSSSK